MADVIGPTSRMPGSLHDLPNGTMCDMHSDRPAVARIQGETDSMGAELNDMCQECLDEHNNYLKTRNTSGVCEWCKNHADKLRERRDYDEGMAGRLYMVCTPCIDRQNRAAAEELDDDY